MFIGIVGAAGLGAALSWQHRTRQPLALATGTFLAPARALPDFSLIDDHGRNFARDNLRGHWSLLFFGFTNCPDLCPATLTLLAAMEKNMLAAGDPVRPKVVFVSVDAARDTPEQLARYIPNFDPEFTGLTARDQTSIETLTARMGVAAKITLQPDGSTSVDHSAAIFVVNPDGQLTAILTGPFTVDALRGDFRRMVAGTA
jgi:protein SCO1/2